MKLYIENGSDLKDGILLLADDLKIELTDRQDADLILTAEQAEDELLRLDLDNRAAKIVYGRGKARFFRALGLLAQAIRD